MQNSLTRIVKRRHTTDPAREQLARDLASFHGAELADLAAILDRHSDSDADAVRDLVDWTRAA